MMCWKARLTEKIDWRSVFVIAGKNIQAKKQIFKILRSLALKPEKNNENMLIIRGNKGVADIYLGEFMRLHSHYAFREAVAENWNENKEWKPQYLFTDDKWQNAGYFKPKHQRFLRREYFAGNS